MRLAVEVDAFFASERRFAERLCAAFTPPCHPNDVRDTSASPGSALVNFTIAFVPGGPTTRHMRSVLHDPELMQLALGDEFPLLAPYEWDVIEETEHRSAGSLNFELQALKVTSAVNIVFALAGAWGLVVFWSITARGQRCRQHAHSSFYSAIIPT